MTMKFKSQAGAFHTSIYLIDAISFQVELDEYLPHPEHVIAKGFLKEIMDDVFILDLIVPE